MEDQYARHGDTGEPESYLSGEKFVGEWKDSRSGSQLGLPRSFSRLLTGVDPNKLEQVPRSPGLDRLGGPVIKKEGSTWMAAIPREDRIQLVYFDPRNQEYRSMTTVMSQLPRGLVERFADNQTGDYFAEIDRDIGGFA